MFTCKRLCEEQSIPIAIFLGSPNSIRIVCLNPRIHVIDFRVTLKSDWISVLCWNYWTSKYTVHMEPFQFALYDIYINLRFNRNVLHSQDNRHYEICFEFCSPSDCMLFVQHFVYHPIPLLAIANCKLIFIHCVFVYTNNSTILFNKKKYK